jgi:hypothetical protein
MIIIFTIIFTTLLFNLKPRLTLIDVNYNFLFACCAQHKQPSFCLKQLYLFRTQRIEPTRTLFRFLSTDGPQFSRRCKGKVLAKGFQIKYFFGSNCAFQFPILPFCSECDHFHNGLKGKI